ncbi:MAG TPA: TetR/AcrR family transcriptional regulator [Spirochaetota bacterium]|mgnify:FL=1|nr:TetR/AcrR family transcriptional regulator [Spirochaetota bacterium]HPD04352.1 TetR/AcrR family transcriptional regulator [Spirochaetota bacterium]HQG41344.1 TetR/AcrR family transcriptional regulator [Spirochaetota bacterium]HQK06341.1 TetR/AcrR family transcriptional regulator [Spirochaetota bacterium]HRR59891.1 TetR/AcrR family transcriptional regulator [Spirochaetota bacterium]
MKRKNVNVIELRRNQLTRAAYKVVSRKGYYNFTVRDIAKEAGLSTGLVHYYFKNKDDLLVSVLRVMNENLSSYLAKALEKIDDPEEKIIIFMDEAFHLVEREKEYFHVLIDFWTQINHNERMRKANIKLYQSYRAECAKIIQEGIDKNVFKDVDVQYTATMIVAFVQGLIIQYIIDNEAFDYTEYTKKIKLQIVDNLMK